MAIAEFFLKDTNREVRKTFTEKDIYIIEESYCDAFNMKCEPFSILSGIFF